MSSPGRLLTVNGLGLSTAATLTHLDPILRSFDALVESDPASLLAISGHRRATRGVVSALARAAGTHLARPVAGGACAPGSLIGLMAPNGPAFLASLIAIRRAGCTALLLDAAAARGEALRVVESLGAVGLLHAACGWPSDPADWRWIDQRNRSGESGAVEPVALTPEIAVVKLSSGSTGEARGIVTPSASLLADETALTATMGLERADRYLCAIPLSHSYGLASLALPALTRGTTLVFPAADNLIDPLLAAQEAEATFFPTVPAYLDALVRMAEPPAWPASLGLVITAGAPLSPLTSERFRATFGLPVHVFYGASECGGIAYDREGGAAERGTVGAPVEGVRIRLEGLNAWPGLAVGSRGEESHGRCTATGVVIVESAAVAAGYLPEPDGRLADGRFRTSDLGAWAGGELALRGRIDDLVNVKGKKVNPREVEAVLARLQGVVEVAVMGVPHPATGSETLRAVVACSRGRLTREEIVGWCREHLSGHKVPRSVILIDRLPRTARGKLDRAALRGLTAERGHG